MAYKNSNVEFVEGKTVLKDHHTGTDVYEGIPKGKFRWDNWLDSINWAASNRSFTIYCKMDPEDMIGLNEAQQYAFHGMLESVADSQYMSRVVLNCEKAH